MNWFLSLQHWESKHRPPHPIFLCGFRVLNSAPHVFFVHTPLSAISSALSHTLLTFLNLQSCFLLFMSHIFLPEFCLDFNLLQIYLLNICTYCFPHLPMIFHTWVSISTHNLYLVTRYWLLCLLYYLASVLSSPLY